MNLFGHSLSSVFCYDSYTFPISWGVNAHSIILITPILILISLNGNWSQFDI